MLDNHYLSTIEVDQGQKVIVPEGILQSTRDYQFILHPIASVPPLWIMMPVDAADHTLLLTDLKSLVPDYEPRITSNELELLGAEENHNVMTYVVLQLDEDETSVRINPHEVILLNPMNGKAKSAHHTRTLNGSEFDLESQISKLTFEEGLVGCSDWKSFLLYQGKDIAPFAMLISLVQGYCSLPVIDPWLVDPAYCPTLSEAEQEELGIKNHEELLWFTILNIEQDRMKATANLLGPLAINTRTGRGLQTVLSNSGYSAVFPVENVIEA